ncbi:hypothetical protein HDV05_007089, partial [Chytridiales sp. JEL 0842]
MKGLPVSVATGDLLVSQLGNSKRRDASLLGDAVNLAARLLSISKKEERLVCDEATFEATKQDLKLVSLGKHLVKGKLDAVQIFSPDSADNTQSPKEPVKLVAIMFFTRPIADIEVDCMARISQLPSVTHIRLNGLTLKETEQLITTKLSDHGVVSVEKTLLDYIFNYTNGHPLKVDMLIGSLFVSSASSYFQVNPSTGQLSTNSFVTLSDRIEAISKTGSALVQFDRLDKQYQDFLRKASLFGQYFSVENINAVFGTVYGKAGSFKSWIEKADNYRFLAIQEGDDIDGDEFFFRHITVQSAIYESLSYEIRSQWHLKAGLCLEQRLTPANCDSILPTISHHFSKTSEIEKNVYYLERLGYSTIQKCFYRESQNALERLISFMERCQIPPTTSALVRAAITDPTRQADWTVHLCYNLVQLKHLDNVVPLCLKALSMVGVTYPMDDDKKLRKAMLRSMVRLYMNWRKTNGGRKLMKINGKTLEYFGVGQTGHTIGDGCTSKCVNCPKARRVISTALRALFQAGGVQTSLSRAAMGLVLFELCNADIGTSAVDNGEFITSLYRTASVLALVMPPLGDVFLKSGGRIESERNLDDKTHNVYYSISYNKVSKGDIAGGCELARKSVTYFQNRDDKSNAQAARVVLSAYPTWLGNLNETLDILDGRWDKTWFKINPIWATVSL